MPTTVLYHSGCPDGYAAAYACWLAFHDRATYVPVVYGQPCPAIPDEHDIYIVDFSYDEETLKRLLATRIGRANHHDAVVTVLDHHASAQRDLARLQQQDLPGLVIRFDMEESGASLTFKYLHMPPTMPDHAQEAALPRFFHYVRDRDLWRWHLRDSKAVSLAYGALEKDFGSIDTFARAMDTFDGLRTIVSEGTAMERYADALVREQAGRAIPMTLAGHQVPVVNVTTLFSEVGDYLCQTNPDIPFVAYYFDRTDQRQWGLRSRGGFDCSVVAKQFGGGGHAGAAGFVTAKGWLPEPAP